jgi:hypothetical protein
MRRRIETSKRSSLMSSGSSLSDLARMARACLGVCLVTGVLSVGGAGAGWAQSVPVIYPSEGQSLEQQALDEDACQSWAQQQTGFHPSQGPAYSGGGGSSGGEVLRGAAGGAALGAVGGAIGGKAGKGAAIGAGVGATAGLLRKGKKQRAQQQADQQAVAEYNRRVGEYNRSFGACMQGRGYAVN